MAWINTDVDIEIDEYLDEASTSALQAELRKRELGQEVGPLTVPPSHTITDLKRAFEKQDPHEFYYLARKVEQLLEAVDG